MSNKNKRYSHLSLPSHEAHPSACAGEVNKQFVIAIIAVAAIVALALLLLFSGQFVGKAIYTGEADTGGIILVSPKNPVKGDDISLSVIVNIKSSTRIVQFKLPLPSGLTCDNVDFSMTLLWSVFANVIQTEESPLIKCENNQIAYELYTLGIGDNLDALSGEQEIANIVLENVGAGKYEFKFSEFNYFDLVQKKEVSLIPTVLTLNVADCILGETLCNGKCVNLQTKENCGSCGIVCKDLESCTAGKCVAKLVPKEEPEQESLIVKGQLDVYNPCGNYSVNSNDYEICIVSIATNLTSVKLGILNKVTNKYIQTKELLVGETDSSGDNIMLSISSLSASPHYTVKFELSTACGNSLLDPNEECDSPSDNSGFFSKTCNSLGFDGGKIKCTTQCKLDTSSCGAKLVPAEEPEQKEGLIVKGQLDVDKPCGDYFVKSKNYNICITSIDLNSVELKIIDKVTNNMMQTGPLNVGETYSFADNFIIMLSISSLSASPYYTVKFDLSTACGNNQLDPNEECDSPPDNSGFFTKNCNDLDFDGGLIQCNKDCQLDTSKCNPKPVVQPVAVEQPAVGGEEAGNVAVGQEAAAGGAAVGGEVVAGAGAVPGAANVSQPAAAAQPLPTAGAGGVAATGTGAEASTTAAGAVQQTKISLTDITPLNNAYSTRITATEDFNTEVTVYTVLYGANNKVLSIKLEKIEAGLKKGTSYTATVNYPLGNVNKKLVIIYDVELKPTIYGKLEKAYVAG